MTTYTLRTTLFFAIALALGAPLFGACAADGSGGGGGGTHTPDGDGAMLEIVGARARTINELAEVDIEVRYVTDDGVPLEGVVDFAIEGEAGGATLSGAAAETNAEGHATITLRAGTQANFDVVAVAPRAEPAKVEITVERMRFGQLSYTVRYDGMRLVDSVEAALFTNLTCSDLSRSVPSPRETQVTVLDRTGTFAEVEVGIPLAIYALGIDRNDNVAAEACADAMLVESMGNVEIELDDVAELFGGTWAIQETFDVTAGFSPTLDTLLDVMTGLSTDPAGYVVDFVATHPSTPGWLRTALSSSVTRTIVAGVLRDAIDDVTLPGYVTETLGFGADVDRAFTQLTLDGQLTFEEPDEFGASLGQHRVTRIYFPLDGGIAERPVSAVAENVGVTVGPTITVAEHQLAIAFGQVIEMILHDVLLPRLPGSPATTHEWLEGLLDCDSIATSIAGETGTVRDATNAVCDVGLALLGGLIEGYLTELWQYDVLHLSGTANLIDSDMDYDRDVLEEGMAQARWVGDSGELSFSGVFEGSKMDDVTGRTHRVRERMRDLH